MLIAHAVLLTGTLLIHRSAASYWKIKDNFDASNWQNTFDIYNGRPTNNEYTTWIPNPDPTLIRSQNNKLYIGVGQDPIIPTTGPRSIQIRSKNHYNEGLIIADIAHMPSNECGLWPSLWLNGRQEPWPAGGEIDLIEGVNLMSSNQVTIHSTPGCIPTRGTPETQTGIVIGETDCGAGSGFVGCGSMHNNETAFGKGFNQVGGGVYALLFTNSTIKVWHWRRGKVPWDVIGGGPDPSAREWGKPVANWAGCEFGKYFRDMQIILDTKFCGGWAGQQYVWGASGCPTSPSQTCVDYVRSHWGSGQYRDAYWLVNSIKVYQQQ